VTRRLVLASQSPARLQLMRQAGLNPEVVVSGVDESTVRAARVAELVALLAAAKAAAVAKGLDDALVVGADSVLEFRGSAYGKPADVDDARLRWQRMSGRSGTLHTGQAVFDVRGGTVTRRDVGVSSTVVHFASPTPAELDAYLATGPFTAHTERTTVDPDELRAAVVRVREQGWSLVDQELEMGLRSISAPIRGVDGRAVAALNVAAAAPRVGLDDLRERFLPRVLATAEQISLAFSRSGRR
jgi:septum formation protein